eukprot:TRINITY_DN5863_c0_g1_i1.p1 TRINITY_DN5863_c0_g1~~TRINITY_DN5863_c0_g1_i1.p1  ORF type:complete len:596 (-),score=90.52 TRINITY_DN5863_c0_g1_i1:93-1850(-)
MEKFQRLFSRKGRLRDPTQAKGVQTSLIDQSDIKFMKEIGEGQFGKVMLGTCRGSQVAIKQIDLSKTAQQELLDEIRILSAERQANIVMLMGVCEYIGEDNVPQFLILTEFCPRGDLRRILEDTTLTIPVSRAIQFAIDIVQGMAWMASTGKPSGRVILHRDLKPANVLVAQDWTCKIADFGLANVARKDKEYHDRKFLPGSLPYMAPEVWETKGLSSALDVYAFAIVLWEIVTRQTQWYKPITKTFERDVVEKKKRPDITQVKHRQLAVIIQDCWDHDPDNRPSFEGLISNNTLQIARADIFLSEFPDAYKFWLENWNSYWVPFEEFCNSLAQFLFIKITPRQEQILRRILFPKTDVGEEDQLTIELFQRLLQWFGALKGSPSIITVMEQLARTPWFFGVLSSAEAKQRLSGTPEATFLVRLNTGKGKAVSEAPFIVSRVDPKTQEIRHTYIHRRSGKGFSVKMPTGDFSGIDDGMNSSGSGQGSKRRNNQSLSSSSRNSSEDQGRTPEKREFEARTIRELLERMSKVKVRVGDKKSALIPFIEPICPGHPFADLFPHVNDKSPTDQKHVPDGGYDVDISTSSS